MWDEANVRKYMQSRNEEFFCEKCSNFKIAFLQVGNETGCTSMRLNGNIKIGGKTKASTEDYSDNLIPHFGRTLFIYKFQW